MLANGYTTFKLDLPNHMQLLIILYLLLRHRMRENIIDKKYLKSKYSTNFEE